MSLLKLSDIVARPWGPVLLQAIDLSVEAGEVLGVIGPNGAGKSSLLQLICGQLALHSGSIQLSGQALQQWTLMQRARRLAVLPQRSVLEFPFTVEEVVRLGRMPHNSGHAADSRVVDEVLAAVDMRALRHRPYTQLSGGERQRTQLARVFAQIWQGEERLLLLDEPTSALDLAHQQQLVQTVARLAADGCAVVMVVHDVNLLAACADRLLALGEGRPHALGEPAQVLTEQLFQTLFSARVHITRHPVHDYPLVIPA